MHAILPRWALNGGPGKCLAEPELLSPFVRASLHLSPSGVDEDGFLLRLAQDRDALLLSNDLYRDHIESGLVSREWVAAHRLPYMFVHGSLMIEFGAGGPSRVASHRPGGTGRAHGGGGGGGGESGGGGGGGESGGGGSGGGETGAAGGGEGKRRREAWRRLCAVSLLRLGDLARYRAVSEGGRDAAQRKRALCAAAASYGGAQQLEPGLGGRRSPRRERDAAHHSLRATRTLRSHCCTRCCCTRAGRQIPGRQIHTRRPNIGHTHTLSATPRPSPVGHCYHQQAVLAREEGVTLDALFGYLRALLAPEPFAPTAQNNLDRLCTELARGPPPAPPPPLASREAADWFEAAVCRLVASACLGDGAASAEDLAGSRSLLLQLSGWLRVSVVSARPRPPPTSPTLPSRRRRTHAAAPGARQRPIPEADRRRGAGLHRRAPPRSAAGRRRRRRRLRARRRG